MLWVRASVRRFLLEESGHAVVEYLFMMFLVIFVCLAGIELVGSQTQALFQRTRDAMP
jgi:Flp pilus assembly pilin Flp